MRRTSSSSVMVIIVIVGLVLAYVLYLTRPVAQLVDNQIIQLQGARQPIDPNILDSESVKARESLQIFGTRPVEASSSALNRRNPFDGL